MNILETLIDTIQAKAILIILNKQNPKELGEKCANVIDKLLDNQLGNEKSEQVQKVLVPWLDSFIDHFNAQLLIEADKDDTEIT